MTATSLDDGPTITRGTVLETVQAYKRTSLLRTAVDLAVFDALVDGPRTAGELADVLGTDPRATRIFVGALAAVGLLRGDGTSFWLPSGAAELLVSSSPTYVGSAVRINASDAEWDALRELSTIVRSGRPAARAELTAFPYWRDFAGDATFVTRSAAATLVDMVSAWLGGRAALHPLRPVRVLDAGCGHALFGLLLAQQLAEVRVTASDWPEVLAVTRERVAAMDLAERVDYVAGDIFTQDLDGPYDLVVAANLLPLFDPDRGVELLRRLVGALAPDGRLVLVGFAGGGGDPADSHSAHLLSLLMLAWTAGGEAHSRDVLADMCTRAGLRVNATRQVGGLPVYVTETVAAHDDAPPRPEREPRHERREP